MADSEEVETVLRIPVGEWEIITEDSFELDWDFDYGDGVEEVVATASVPVFDGWTLRVQLTRADGETIFRPFVLVPPEGEEGRWLTSTVFSKLRLPEVREAIENDIYSDEAKQYLPARWFDTFDVVPNPGRGGRRDQAYAVWVKRYLDACEVDQRRPWAVLLERFPNDERAQIQGRLDRAKGRGIWTREHGRPGGELTDYGRRLLAGLKEEL